ncbi:DUF6640 family protein [Brevundimonas sp.]|uniref:DUF6640 family protein n=1 Tax=Brevundimonas sp. TaxID=1871086 RepID=UPI003F6E8352
MINRILTTLGLLVLLVLLPVLEIRDTHVFNPDWPPHARLHEVWQLTTNAGVALVGLWLVWRRGAVQLAGVLGLCMIGGALVAHALAPSYGGALAYPGGPNGAVLGIHVAVIVPAAAALLFSLAILMDRGLRCGSAFGARS